MLNAVDVPSPLLQAPQTPGPVGRTPGAVNEAHDRINCCLPMVESIARRLHGSLPENAGVELHDLAQSGLLGLVSAGRCYDPSAAVPFSVYARYRIEGEMLDSLRRQDVAPRKLRRWQKQVSEARRRLAATLHREPTEDELCDRLMVSMVEMRGRAEELNRTQPPRRIDDEREVDPISGPETDPDRMCAQRQLRELLDSLIGALPERYQHVIRMHYSAHMTIKEISSKMGVNESRVSQIHRTALGTMGRKLKQFGISSPADV